MDRQSEFQFRANSTSGEQRFKPWRILVFIVAGVLVAVGVFHDLIFSPPPRYATKLGATLPKLWVYGENQKKVDFSRYLDQHAHGKKVVVSLWATWCTPCLHELPDFQKKLPALQKSNLELVLVNYDGAMAESVIPKALDWQRQNKLSFLNTFDLNEELLTFLGVASLPFHLGLDEKRRIVWVHSGEINLNFVPEKFL